MKPLFYQAYCHFPAPIAAEFKQWIRLMSPTVQAFYLWDLSDLWASPSFKMFFPLKHGWKYLSLSLNVCMQSWYKRFMPDWQRGYGLSPPSYPQDRDHELGINWLMNLRFLCFKCSTSFWPQKNPLLILHHFGPVSLKVEVEELKKEEADLPPEDADSCYTGWCWLKRSTAHLQERGGAEAWRNSGLWGHSSLDIQSLTYKAAETPRDSSEAPIACEADSFLNDFDNILGPKPQETRHG